MARKPKVKLTPEEIAKCNAIIHGATAAATAATAGIAQIPLMDSAVITPIQVTMIISLGAVFDQVITKETAKGILSAAAAAFVGRGISQVLWGWVPGVGNAINGGTAAAITEAIGWMAVDRFKQAAEIDEPVKEATEDQNKAKEQNATAEQESGEEQTKQSGSSSSKGYDTSAVRKVIDYEIKKAQPYIHRKIGISASENAAKLRGAYNRLITLRDKLNGETYEPLEVILSEIRNLLSE